MLNFLVTTAKLSYGYWTGSVALGADGVQSLPDGRSNVVGLVSVAIAARPPDEEHHVGHERYETLASLLIAAMMSVSVIQILQGAVYQLRKGSSPTVNAGSFGVFLATMSVNIGAALQERHQGKRSSSDLLLADATHTASDVVAFSVITGLPGVKAGWNETDAVVSVGIIVILAWAAGTIIRNATYVLTGATNIDTRALMRSIPETGGGVTAHTLMARSSGGRVLAQVDITVDMDISVTDTHEIASRVERSMMNDAGEESQAVVHIEPAVGRHTHPDALFGDVHVLWKNKRQVLVVH